MIYLDNGATTQVCEEAVAACVRAFENFGNPSSLHALGLAVKNEVKNSAAIIENIINAEEGTFYFTSGATEANNWAVFGAAGFNTRRGMHIITSKTEHPSVLEPIYELERRNFEITYLTPDKEGNINLDELVDAIRSDTVLVSLMNVNNETGAINDVFKIGKRIKQINKSVIFHVDGVCSFCKISVDVRESCIDLFSVSGHKLHAPKGIGGLYIRKGTKIGPFIFGGGQQKNLRSGTENTSFISAFAAAASLCGKEMADNMEKMKRVKKRFMDGILSLKGEINGCLNIESASPYILNAGFRGMKSQILVNALEQRGIYISSGSACSSNKKRHSKPLAAMGIDAELIEGSVRFSFSKYTSEKEVDVCLEALSEILDKYRGHK